MNHQACLVIGNIRDGECEGLSRRGIDVFLIRDTKVTSKITTASHVSTVAEYDFDLGYSEWLRELVARVLSPYSVKSVLNFRESYVAVTEKICSSIPSLSLLHRNVERTLDKAIQRRLFSKSGNPDLHVRSKSVTVEDLTSARVAMDFPYILKPSNLYSSLFVKRIDNQQALHAYLENEWPALNRYVAGSKPVSDQLLIEDYLLGSNHSIDCAVDRYGNITCFPIVDVITGMEIGRGDFHHFARYSPSVIPDDLHARCQRVAIDAIQALELRGTFAHVEFILTSTGPRIIELAARPGGSRIHVLREAYGLDLDLAYHHALSGQPVEAASAPATPFGIVTPFPKKSQSYRGLHAEAQISSLPHFKKWYSFVGDGDPIGPVGDGFQNSLFIEFEADEVSNLTDAIAHVSRLEIYEGA